MSERRERFRAKIEELIARFESDLDRDEWITRRYPKRMRDEKREVYEVPSLSMQKGPTRLFLDPIGDDVPGSEATAELYLMPAYDPLLSAYFENGRWALHYAFPENPDCVEALPLSGETINRVLNSIADHAVPSV